MPPKPGSVKHLAIRIKRILFATDFSRTSAMALPYAAAFARRFQAEIYATHVIPPEEYAHIAPEELEATLGTMKEAARKRIQGLLAASSFSDIPFRIILDHGDVMETIATLVEEQEIDLIVTGSHGRHGIQKLVSASIDEAIARAAHCPVLLVGPEVVIAPEEEARIERILHPIHFHPQSKRVLDFAFALAHAYGASLDLLHVADDAWKEPLATRMTPEAFCRTQLMENGLQQSEYGVEPEFLVEFGPPEDLTLEVARRREIQLIVVGVPVSVHPHLASHLPGPLAYDVASHSACPVLAVRSAEAGS